MAGGTYTKDPYAGSGTYTKDPYAGSGGTPVAPAKPSGHGFLHALSTVASDLNPARLVHGAAGLGQAGYDFGKVIYEGDKGVFTGNQKEQQQASDTVGAYTKGIAKSYKARYTPLLQGHVGKFAGQLYHDPLSYLLDAATVATLGGAGAARGGELLAKAGAISKESRLAQLGKPVDIAVPDWNGEMQTIKQSSANPAIRARQLATNKALQRLPEQTPFVGTTSRIVKAISKDPERAAARLRIAAEPFNQAFAGLNLPERAAWHMAARGLEPADYHAFISEHPDVSPAMLKLLAKPKVAELVANPTPRLQNALDLGRQLSDLMTKEKLNQGILTEQSAAEAPYRTLRLMSGAKGVEPTPALLGQPSKSLLAKRANVARLEAASARAQSVVQRFKFTAADAKRIMGPGARAGDVATAYPTDESVNLRAQLRPLEKELRAQTAEWNAPATAPGAAARMSEADAQARMNELDAQHEALVQKILPEVSPWGPQVKGSAAKREQLWRNTVNSKLAPGARIGTVKAEERAIAEQRLHEIAETNAPTNATASRIHGLITERQQLRDLLNQRGGSAIAGEAPLPLPATGAPEPSLYEQRAGLHRILRVGTVAQKAMGQFTEAAGAASEAVPGLAELHDRVGALTDAINEARGFPPEDLVALRKQVAQVRSDLRAAEAPRSYRVGGENPRALTPEGELVKPRGAIKAERLGTALSVARDQLEQAEARFHRGIGPTGIVGGKPIEQIAQELHAAGKTQPFYVPDSAAVPGTRVGRFTRRATGLGEPGPLGSQHLNLGELASSGRLNVGENALGREMAMLANRTEGAALHDELLKHAAELPKGQPLPLGYDHLKISRGEPGMPYTQQVANPLEHALEPGSADKFLTKDPNDPLIATRNGNRLVVPSDVRQILEDRASTYHGAMRKLLYNQPTSVWKHLILGLRPAFFANITVGNSILGALQMAPGLHGPAEWLRQVVPGAEKALGAGITSDTVDHVFPEQAGGTFGGTMGFRANKGLRAASKVYQGVMPATIAYENVLRRAMLGGWARATPEVRALMQANGGDVNQAVRDLAETHPHIINELSKRTDDALGNYRSYNRLERAIRQVIPFYGWDRHIVRSVARLASERPVRLNALLNAGNIGNQRREQQLGPVPSYGEPWVRLPGLPKFMGPLAGRTPVLNLKSANPFNTVVDLAGVPQAVLGKAGGGSDVLSGMNPLLQAALEQLTGRSLLTGAPVKGNALLNFATAIPQASLIQAAAGGGAAAAKPTSLYRNDWQTQLAALLGIPIKKVNLQTAHYRATQKP